MKKKRLLKSYRSVSPVIAEILLIGLVVLAASSVFVIGIAVITSKSPLELKIVASQSWSLDSSSFNTKYNNFDLILENQGSRDIGIDSDSFLLSNSTGILDTWTMESDVNIFSQQRIKVRIESDAMSEWLVRASEIKIEITAYALDEQRLTASTISRSLETIIIAQESVKGPLIISLNNSIISNSGTVAIDIENYGGSQVNYNMDIFSSNGTINLTLIDSNSKILTQLSGINGSIIPATPLTPSSTKSTGQTLILLVNATSLPSGTYFVYVWLRVSTNLVNTQLIVVSIP